MKDFFLGFFAAYFIFVSLWAVRKSLADSGQSQSGYQTQGQIQQDMENLFKDKQNKNLFVAISTPAVTSMGQGDIQFSTSSLKGWTRYQNDRYFFVLTKF